MRIDNQLANAMAQVPESTGFAQKPLITNQLAVVISADEYHPKSGGAPMLLIESKLLGGQHDGTILKDFLGVMGENQIVREIALRRLKQALKATGCEGAADTSVMAGRKLLVTTRQRIDKRTNEPTVDVDRYGAPSAEQSATVVPSVPSAPPAPSLPPFVAGGN